MWSQDGVLNSHRQLVHLDQGQESLCHLAGHLRQVNADYIDIQGVNELGEDVRDIMNPEAHFHLMYPHLALAAPMLSSLVHTLPASRRSCAFTLNDKAFTYKS